MLHLFNKVYLEFDDKIEINFDRVVISERYGVSMYKELDKVAYGELITYSQSYDDIVKDDFAGFIASIKDFANNSKKKVIIYCDKSSYKKFMAQWFKVILPNLDFESFKKIVDFTIYNQRIVSNTQLSSVYSVNLNSLWEGVGDIKEVWEQAEEIDPVLFENMELNYSYEFLFATYLSGDSSRKEELRKTLHMFLRRWLKEMFTDNRQMVLLNITNHKFLSTFNIDPELVDITLLDPLAPIPQLESYADDEIWERDQNQYGECKLEGLSEEKAIKLKDTLLSIFGQFEGMQTNQTVFGTLDYVTAACADKLSDEDMDSIIDYITREPFDTAIVPRFDFQNVNFPLLQFFLAEKFNERDLSKYRLL